MAAILLMVYHNCRMLNHKHLPLRGFTLVELLLVVIVIAILATLAVIGYQGVRERGYNAKLMDGVRQYYEAIEVYKARFGQYPQTSIERDNPSATVALTCLGAGYKNGSCGLVTGTTIYENAYFNQQMNTLVETPPALGELNISVQPETFTGAVYGIDATSSGGTGYGRTLQWALIGKNADCKIPGAYSYTVSSSPPTTACEILLESVTR